MPSEWPIAGGDSLRILHLGKYYPPAPGGIESHVQTLARGQADLGHEVSVLCVNHTDQAGNDITHSRWRKTISFIEMDGKVRVERVGRLFGLSRLEVCPGLITKLRVETERADVVHLHTPNPLMLGAWWAAGAREKLLVVTHHSDVIKQRLLRYCVAPFESAVYRLARLILTTSPKYLEGSGQLRPYRDKVKSLPLAIDMEPFLFPTKQIMAQVKVLQKTAGNNGPLWLMVGRLTYYKGYHVAIEALVNVPGRLVIVGSGPIEKKLKRQAEQLKVAERIIWKPSVSQEELIALYRAATALWFPSVARSEGFGLVQVEAMACGCPVINTDIPESGVSWVSQNDVSGLTVPVGDPKQLAFAANRISGDLHFRNRSSDGAKRRAVSEFDSKLMVRRSIEMYRQAETA